MTRCRLYGLVVDSELDLGHNRPATGPADVTVRRGPSIPPPHEEPPGRRLLHYEPGDQPLFTASQEAGGGYVLRFYRTADFVIDPGLRHVVVHAVDGADSDTLGVLISGTLLSFLLAMRGAPVLHASAVELGGVAVGFVGSSGMGKSTTATFLCAAGGRLVTDDVLRLELGRSRPRCHLGATALRLRKSADQLATLFATTPGHRVTGDGRDALSMTPSVTELLPLAALVIPVPQHGGGLTRPQIVPLEPKQALLTLLQFPRIVGWEDPRVLDRQLQELGTIVDTVPVYVARLPWGPPFSPTLALDLAAGLGLGAPAGTSGRPS